MNANTHHSKPRRFIRLLSPLVPLTLVAACTGPMLEEEEELGEVESEIGSIGSGIPIGPQPGGTLCVPTKIWFKGQCRVLAYFERFVTPGASLIAVEGGRTNDGRGAIAIIESPNARTSRVRVVSTTPAPAIVSASRKYMSGHEVLAEATTTTFISDAGHIELLQTVDAAKDGAFETVWYKRVAEGNGKRYRWGTDYCDDAFGVPLGYEPGEACGPLISQTLEGTSTGGGSSGGGLVMTPTCESWASFVGNAQQLACTVFAGIMTAELAAAAVVPSGGTALVLASSGGAAAVTVGGAGLVGALTAGLTACDAVGGMAQALAELQCMAAGALWNAATAPPAPVAIQVNVGTSLQEDPCEPLGGEEYEGEPGVYFTGTCDDVDTGGIEAQVTVGVGDADYEITVHGEPQECDPFTILPNETYCVVIAG